MIEEKNQSTEGFQVHETVVLQKIQRTGDDGKKLGYSFYAKGTIGLISEISAESMVIIYPDRSEEKYIPSDIDKDYYYVIARASEVEYQKAIDKELKTKTEQARKLVEKAEEIQEWSHEFKHSISLLGKLARFIKGFNG